MKITQTKTPGLWVPEVSVSLLVLALLYGWLRSRLSGDLYIARTGGERKPFFNRKLTGSFRLSISGGRIND